MLTVEVTPNDLAEGVANTDGMPQNDKGSDRQRSQVEVVEAIPDRFDIIQKFPRVAAISLRFKHTIYLLSMPATQKIETDCWQGRELEPALLQ